MHGPARGRFCHAVMVILSSWACKVVSQDHATPAWYTKKGVDPTRSAASGCPGRHIRIIITALDERWFVARVQLRGRAPAGSSVVTGDEIPVSAVFDPSPATISFKAEAARTASAGNRPKWMAAIPTWMPRTDCVRANHVAVLAIEHWKRNSRPRRVPRR